VEEVTSGLSVADRDDVVAGVPLTAEALCRTYAGRVYKFAQLISADSTNAEDLAQDALERAIRGLRTFNPAKGEIDGWLWRIAVNAGRDAGRIAGRQRLVFERLADRWSVDEQVVDLGDELTRDEVLEAVRALSSRHRAVVALRFGADLSYRGVGQALGISEAAALMTTRRALSNLRTRLSQGVNPR
jgi:RNA polymerase sigma-70 factor (ECF subfamily)